MFYITVLEQRHTAVVADGRGRPRIFPAGKKARNFVDGRPYLKLLKPRIVSEITHIPDRKKVDL